MPNFVAWRSGNPRGGAWRINGWPAVDFLQLVGMTGPAVRKVNLRVARFTVSVNHILFSSALVLGDAIADKAQSDEQMRPSYQVS